jgi:cholesterol transport system auxiliary component
MTSISKPARRAFLVVAVMALGGCGALSRPAPIKQTYLLDPPPPAVVAKSQPTSVRVGNVNVAVPFRGRPIVFRESDLRYENAYYLEFLVPPATMLAELTSRALERSKAFARVVPPGSAAATDWELDGFVSALYLDTRDASKPAAEVAITYYLFAAQGGKEMPVWTRDYQRRAPLAGTSEQAYAAALNAAVGEILSDLSRDLAAAELKRN